MKNAREVVTENFLCSGGIEPKTDDVACKGMFDFCHQDGSFYLVLIYCIY